MRFPFNAQFGTLSAAIQNGKSLSTALDDYTKSLQGLAPQSGYKVVTK